MISMLIFLALGWWASADVTLVCMMERIPANNEVDRPVRQTEYIEKPLAFSPAANGVMVANLSFEFGSAPNFVTTIQIFESLQSKGKSAEQLKYRSVWITREKVSGREIAKDGEEIHEFADGTYSYTVYCDGFTKTENLNPVIEPKDIREKLRVKHFGGLGYKRDYVALTDNEEAEIGYEYPILYDFMNQLLRIESLGGQILRETWADLHQRGFQRSALHTYERLGIGGTFKKGRKDQKCPGEKGKSTCYYETFEVYEVFTGPPEAQSEIHDYLHLVINGRIIRNSKTKAIVGYEIRSVHTFIPRQGGGGGSSSSGGRIGGVGQ